MFNYANKANVTTNANKSELLFTFTQSFPVLGEKDADGNPVMQDTPIAELVMVPDFARDLARLINEILGE